MKRLAVLMVGCLVLGLGTLDGAFGQKKGMDKDVIPEIKDIPKLIANLKDKDPKVRAAACKGLGLRGEVRITDVAEAVAPIAGLVTSDPDAEVRREAAYALGMLVADKKDSVAALTKALESDSEMKVKTAAAASLGNFGADARIAIAALKEAEAIGKAAGKDKEKKAEAELGKAAGQSLRRISQSGKE
jgi:HEAT repeat protein